METAVVAVHKQLKQAGIPHAFGGAFAMAYYGAPRPTKDIDVNVFVPVSEWPRVSKALTPLGIDAQVDGKDLRKEGQARLRWRPHPLHLFFSCDPLHEEMEHSVTKVPCGDGTIPLVAPEHLIIRKTLLGRPKDRQDIERILAHHPSLDRGLIEKRVRQMQAEESDELLTTQWYI